MRKIKQESCTGAACLRFCSNQRLLVLVLASPQDLRDCTFPALLSTVAKDLSTVQTCQEKFIWALISASHCQWGWHTPPPYTWLKKIICVQNIPGFHMLFHMWCSAWKHPVQLFLLWQILSGKVLLFLVLSQKTLTSVKLREITWRKWLGSSNQNVFLKFVWLIFLKWEINCIVQNTKQATPPCHGSIMCVGLKREITFEFLTLGIASACCSAVKPTLLKRRQDSTLFI